MDSNWIDNERRLYRRDVIALLGWRPTWLAEQIRRGVFPPPLTDVGGKRSWWRAATVREAIIALNSRAVPQAAPHSAARGRK